MKSHNPSQRSRVVKAIVGILILATVIRVWVPPEPLLPIAQAQIPDSGQQRFQLIDEARRTNQLLAQLVQVLQTQTLKVRIEGTDNKAAADLNRRDP